MSINENRVGFLAFQLSNDGSEIGGVGREFFFDQFSTGRLESLTESLVNPEGIIQLLLNESDGFPFLIIPGDFSQDFTLRGVTGIVPEEVRTLAG